jgi:sulfatase modifying factor 1
MRFSFVLLLFAGSCVQQLGPFQGATPTLPAEEPVPPIEPTPVPIARCADGMVEVQNFCMDRFEAPNQEGALPLVMYNLYEGQDWCEARGKRLCYDDEWTSACAGSQNLAYPYGNQHKPGQCNDEETWRVYSQSDLNQWPSSVSSIEIDSYEALIVAASANNSIAADEIESLYQAEASGSNPECGGEYGVFDLVGNIEEWTARRDGGDGGEFTGNLKGRYWAESRTCQGSVTNHGNGFRFYEIGFRCCSDINE